MTDNINHRIKDLNAELLQVKQELTASKADFLNVVGKSRDGILIFNAQGIVVYANPAALAVFDKGLGDLLGEHAGVLIGGTQTTELTILNKERGAIIVEINVADTFWNEKPAKLATLRDITEKKRAAELLEHLSRHDYLTDLPNRAYFEEKLAKTLEKSKRHQLHMAVMYLDMDKFKLVNDTLGHDVGDALLKYAVQSLKKTIRSSDTLARLGGDEFAIILDDLKTPLNAAEVAQKVVDLSEQPFIHNSKKIPLHFSIGIAVFPMAGMTAQALTKHADMALYLAKEQGRHQYQFFNESLNAEAIRINELQNNLQMALTNNEFYLQYQPIILAKDLSLYGIEALLRWQNPHLGDVPVSEFLPIIEDSKQIQVLGTWILKTACEQYKSEPILENIRLSVNFSLCQLLDDTIVDTILSVIKNTNMNTRQLIIELTETVVMKDPEQNIQKLETLAKNNIMLAIDDFGTGFSSFSYLKRLPIILLKIDQTFVQDIGVNENNTIIVKAIINLAKKLGLKTIAEGIETKQQADFLREQGCDMLQGFYFSKALDFPESLINFLKQYSPHNSS